MNILGPEVSYCDLLDYEIEEHLKQPQPKRYPLSPSAAGKCSRALAYDLMEYKDHATYEKEPMKPAVYRLLNLGHSIEYSALKNFQLLKDFQLKYKQQSVHLFKLAPTPDDPAEKIIEGSMDVVMWSDKYKGVLDVKSQKDGFSSAFKTRWHETLDKYSRMSTLTQFGASAFYADDIEAFIAELGGDFLVDNLIQINLYACSDFLVERGIDHAIIFKYNKNTSEHYEIRFKPSKELFQKTVNKFNIVNEAVSRKAPEDVPKDFVLGGMRCAFCPYSKECWGQDGLKAWFKTMPKKEWPTDVDRLPKEVGSLFASYEKAVADGKQAERIEQEIVKALESANESKVRLDTGAVYEVKYLKSPKPHFELRRVKV